MNLLLSFSRHISKGFLCKVHIHLFLLIVQSTTIRSDVIGKAIWSTKKDTNLLLTEFLSYSNNILKLLVPIWAPNLDWLMTLVTRDNILICLSMNTSGRMRQEDAAQVATISLRRCQKVANTYLVFIVFLIDFLHETAVEGKGGSVTNSPIEENPDHLARSLGKHIEHADHGLNKRNNEDAAVVRTKD
jgi:hypothetical protein